MLVRLAFMGKIGEKLLFSKMPFKLCGRVAEREAALLCLGLMGVLGSYGNPRGYRQKASQEVNGKQVIG